MRWERMGAGLGEECNILRMRWDVGSLQHTKVSSILNNIHPREPTGWPKMKV